MEYFLKHQTGNPRNSEGSFVRLSDGRLYFAYTRYRNENGDWNDHATADICAIISADDGQTWSEPFTVVKNQHLNVMSVSLLRLSDGRIALAYGRKSAIPGHENVDCRPLIRFSSDEAKSWSEPIDIINLPPIYLGSHNDRLVQLKSGRLILPTVYHPYGGHSSYALRQGIALFFLSDAGGPSWRQSMEYCYPPHRHTFTRGLMEPGVVELSDGRLLCWFRTTSGCQYKSWSYDQGETWSTPVPAPEFPSPESPLSMKTDPVSGDLIAIWNDYSPERSVRFTDRNNGTRGRTPLVLARSSDNGNTWTDHIVLENAPDHGYGYTAMLFEEKQLFLAYCCGGIDSCEHMLQDIKIRTFTL